MIYQLYYNDATRAMISPAATPIDVRQYKVNPYFESKIIACEEPKRDTYIAYLSARFNEKTNITIERVMDQLKGADYYYYNYPHKWPNVWQQGEHAHPGIMWRAASWIERTGNPADVLADPTVNIFCNYWVMKHELFCAYQHYLREFIYTRPDHVLHRTSYYGRLSREELMQATGKPFYTFAPFILERMVGTWLAKHKSLKGKILTK